MNNLMNSIRDAVRAVMGKVASSLNRVTGGRLSPNAVTITALLAHIPIAWLIATTRNNLWAAILLIIFGLFDSLDGQLARLQGKAGSAGMLLDATADRMKEVILYMGVAMALFNDQQYFTYTDWAYPAVVVAAIGGSLLVSYVKAKGETAVAGGKLSANEINRLFQDGLARFEVRMSLLILGLFLDQLFLAVIIVAVLSWFTAFERLIKISRKLA